MADWMRGIDWADVVRVEIVRVTLEGTPSCVTSAVLRLRLRDGRAVDEVARFDYVLYETLQATVRDANRDLRR